MQSKSAGPRIGEMLVEAGLVSDEQVNEALKMQQEQGGKTVGNLIALGYLEPSDFLGFLSSRPGIAVIDLLNYIIPRQVIDLIPAEFALKHEIVPIDKMGKQLTVGMVCPLDSRTIDELAEITGLTIRPLVLAMKDAEVALDRYYRPRKGTCLESYEPEPETEARPPQELEAEEVLPLVETAITFEGVMHLVRQIGALPALPETVGKVHEAMASPETSTADAAAIIRTDPSISAKVIGLANSPGYGFSHRVDNVELASTLLGLREVYSVVLSAAVIDYFQKSSHFDYRKFWKRAMFCAMAALATAAASGRKRREGLFSAGLLHDLGRAVFAEIVPERYAQIDQELAGDALIDREKELFAVAHPEIGYVLAETWELPKDISVPIRFHHDILKAPEKEELVAIVGLAALMADIHDETTKGQEPDFGQVSGEQLELLSLSREQLAGVFDETVEAFEGHRSA